MRKLKPIIMDGEEYEVIDNLGFHHSVGKYAKEIKVGDRLRIVTSSSTRGTLEFS